MSSPKKIITSLLLIACILSGLVFSFTPAYIPSKISTETELDSLIKLSFEDASLLSDQIRTNSIKTDSSFSRKVFRIKVPPTFSKTSFHLELHKKFYSLGITTPARVVFPEENMNIYMVNDGTIFRTIQLITDNSLLTEE